VRLVLVTSLSRSCVVTGPLHILSALPAWSPYMTTALDGHEHVSVLLVEVAVFVFDGKQRTA
jgi:hypothetical protein